MTTSGINQKSRNGASRLRVSGSGGTSLFVIVEFAVMIGVAAVIYFVFGSEAVWTFALGGTFGYVAMRLATARDYFMLARFRNVLTQYAGLNDPIGDQARDVLREEREGGH